MSFVLGFCCCESCEWFAYDAFDDDLSPEWIEDAGTWAYRLDIDRVETSSANARLICATANPEGDAEAIVDLTVGLDAFGLGAELRVLFAYEDADHWVAIGFRLLTTTGFGPRVEVRYYHCDGGVTAQVGAAQQVQFSAVPGLPSVWRCQWDGTYLSWTSHYLPAGVFVPPPVASRSMRIAAPPTGAQVGVGSGINDDAVGFREFRAYFHKTTKSNCHEVAAGCTHCAAGQYTTQWEAEFSGVVNGLCNQCTALNAMTIALTRPGPPLGAPGIFGGCNAVWPPACQYGGAQQPAEPTDTLAQQCVGYVTICSFTGRSMGAHVMTVVRFPAGGANAGKYQLQYAIHTGDGQMAATFESDLLDEIDCSGETDYALAHASTGSGWNGCDFTGATLTVRPVGGAL